MAHPPISIIILTQDEEAALPGCLDSVAGFDDVHVLDSGSTDRTVAVAQARGVPVHYHPFHGFGQQRNWAIDHISTRHAWQFHLDADERLTPGIIGEIAERLAANPTAGGYFVPSKLMFCGRWLRHAGDYPGYQVRLFHKDRLRFTDHGHGQREVTTFPLEKLREPMLHHAFIKGLDHWFAKHAKYARREAELALAAPREGPQPSLFSWDPLARRRALKRLTARLPFRYTLRLLYMLIAKRAFLDGRPGLVYAHMLATYEAMTSIHLTLLRHGLKVDDGVVSTVQSKP